MKGLGDREKFGAFVEGLKETASAIFYDEGRVMPLAFVVATVDPDGNPFPSPVAIPTVATRLSNPEDYAGFIKMIRKTCIATKAVGVAFIAESWFAAVPLGPDEKPSLDRFPSLNENDMKGARREGILVTVDHVALESTTRWISFIVRSLGKPTLERWRRIPNDPRVMYRERFSEMFPRELWQ